MRDGQATFRKYAIHSIPQELPNKKATTNHLTTGA
jgi:hypothetical protein